MNAKYTMQMFLVNHN